MGTHGASTRAQHTLFVANSQDDTLSAVDASTCNAVDHSSCGQKAPTVQVGDGPQALATDPSTGTVYAANVDAGTTSVVNADTCNATMTRGCRAEARTSPVG